ncbi:MAG: cytochrome c family protein [Bacteroidales bacterium]|nr:cytochrome c family protein [Bacteroidales bacterium]
MKRIAITIIIVTVTFGLASSNKIDSLGKTELLILGNELYFNHDTITGAKSCVSCHAVEKPDTFYWTPCLEDIAPAVSKLSESAFEELILYPYETEKLMDAHANYDFNAQELLALKTYILEQCKQNKTGWSKSLIKIVFLGILLLVLSLLLWDYTKKRRLKYSIVYALSIITIIIASIQFLSNEELSNTLIEQPLKFSHALHVTENNIDCRFCHADAYQSAHAGIPTVKDCYGCHLVVREGKKTGSFELRKLHHAYDSGYSIQWNKSGYLPHFIRFNHSAHVVNGQLDCQTCHGNIEQMNRTVQPIEYTMKFCLDCHAQSNINLSAQIVNLPYNQLNGWDCNTCHR